MPFGAILEPKQNKKQKREIERERYGPLSLDLICAKDTVNPGV
jgi:hypothetical protein